MLESLSQSGWPCVCAVVSFLDAQGAKMWLIWTVLIGLATGWLVAFLAKDRRGGLAADLAVGIAGSLLGGLIGKYLGLGRHSLLGRAVISLLAAAFFLIIQQVIKSS